jgi:sec-independent protein translocase protein TatC
MSMDNQTGQSDKEPFFSHLKELRNRLIICIIAVAVAFLITYNFKEKVFDFLMAPFVKVMPAHSSFIFMAITEAFITYFKISVVTAIFLVSPVILYQFWRFVSPGLYEKERYYVYPFIFWGSFLFLSGMTFCYFVVMPYLFKFFVGYSAEFIIPMPSLKAYMSLALKMLAFFGFIFEMPLVAYFLSKAGIINYRMLSAKRRYAILAIFVVAAMFVSADAVSLILVAFPLWGLYEMSILIARIFGDKEKEIIHETS